MFRTGAGAVISTTARAGPIPRASVDTERRSAIELRRIVDEVREGAPNTPSMYVSPLRNFPVTEHPHRWEVPAPQPLEVLCDTQILDPKSFRCNFCTTYRRSQR